MTPYRKKEFYQGGYYHIFNRGVNKGLIFFNDGNFRYCLRLLRKYLAEYDLTLIVYCLMPNHYHFIIRQETDFGISECIRDMFNAYSQAVNKQQHRIGTLFQGRFRHIHIDKDEYILHLCRYIYLNPVKGGLVVVPEQWAWSNYQDWIGIRKGMFADIQFMLDSFGSGKNYKRFVMDYREEKSKEKVPEKYLLE